jgi:hypothetical protein
VIGTSGSSSQRRDQKAAPSHGHSDLQARVPENEDAESRRVRHRRRLAEPDRPPKRLSMRTNVPPPCHFRARTMRSDTSARRCRFPCLDTEAMPVPFPCLLRETDMQHGIRTTHRNGGVCRGWRVDLRRFAHSMRACHDRAPRASCERPAPRVATRTSWLRLASVLACHFRGFSCRPRHPYALNLTDTVSVNYRCPCLIPLQVSHRHSVGQLQVSLPFGLRVQAWSPFKCLTDTVSVSLRATGRSVTRVRGLHKLQLIRLPQGLKTPPWEG